MSEIQIKAGKWRRRDGKIVDVVARPQYYEQGPYPWINASDLSSYTSHGCVVGDGYPHNFDLIEYIDEPTQPEPAKAELVPGWYTNADQDKVYFVGVDGDGNYVFTHYGESFIGCGKSFVPYLTPYTPPHEPRTWTVDVVVYAIPDGEFVGYCLKEVGEKLFSETNKELGRETVTIKEKVTQ